MALLRSIKTKLKTIDQQVPFIRNAVKGSALVRGLLLRSRLVSSKELAVVGEGFLPILTLQELPEVIRFRLRSTIPELTVLLGTSHYHPFISSIVVDATIRDIENNVICRSSKQLLKDIPAVPPLIVRDYLPEITTWYELSVGKITKNAEFLVVRFQYGNETDRPPMMGHEFRFFCGSVGYMDSDNNVKQCSIDFSSCMPLGAKLLGESRDG